MNNLDTLNLLKVDPEGMYYDIDGLGRSFVEGYLAMKQLPIPSHYIKCKKIVFCGMGGSGIAGSLVNGLIGFSIRLPIEIVSNYKVPGYVDNETLVVGVSYSGKTEEVLEFFIDSYKKGARLVAMGTGGELENLARKYNTPFYRHQTTTCNEPRMASARHFGAILSLVDKISQLEISEKEIIEISDLLANKLTREWGVEVPTGHNLAKKIAKECFDKIPVIWGADHLEALAHRLKADFNENTKSLSYFEPLPEMNHKSLVGSEFPKPLIKNIAHIFLKSRFGHERNRKRTELTYNFFKKRHFYTELIEFSEAKTPLSEIMLGLMLSCLVSFYLAGLYGIDPSPVEAVQEFKSQLK